MSAPFEFTFMGADGKFDPDAANILGPRLSAWLDEDRGENMMVFGVLAFDDDMHLVGVRVESLGDPDGENGVDVTGQGWDGVETWMREQDARHLFTFVRRTPSYGHGVLVGNWDRTMLSATLNLVIESEDDLVYQGHVIMNDGECFVVDPRTGDSSFQQALAMDSLLGNISDTAKATIITELMVAICARFPSIDPAGPRRIGELLERSAEGVDLTPEESAEIDALLDAMRTAAESDHSLGNILPVAHAAPAPERTPDIPAAFVDWD